MSACRRRSEVRLSQKKSDCYDNRRPSNNSLSQRMSTGRFVGNAKSLPKSLLKPTPKALTRMRTKFDLMTSSMKSKRWSMSYSKQSMALG
ncbi:hypothetical protein FOVG_19840 [Fusarium oxysporum f. sp. pisi HDV247]|uniref:Uncharacterized protein n=1 Tax=Fusarium oxysporum f. sp. pisi HDV247 TaxID=1080344 RepID=W9NCX0_FUSOX|nr:hypothetical protein FOVG_19840 [Fusarium oxysporum f. sp. pisi HDV247]